tara:strand:- start:415 stop:777 length:363 start_codon:yes stop_codon:yes gene_type:complete
MSELTKLERLQKEVDYAEAAEATHADFYAAKERKKLEQLAKNVADTDAAYADAADVYTAAFDEAGATAVGLVAAAYTGTTDYDVAYAIAYDARCAADAAYDAWSRARKELSNYLKEQDNE